MSKPKRHQSQYHSPTQKCQHEDMRITKSNKWFCQECFSEWNRTPELDKQWGSK